MQVIVDRVSDHVVGQLIAQPLEQRAQLFGREQVEEHEHVGLLGDLVGVRRVPLRFQDPIEAMDDAVAFAIPLPVELFELLVALELADHAVAVEHDEHLAAHVVPSVKLLLVERELGPQGLPSRCRQQRECLERALREPCRHHVGVRVVVQPGSVRVRVSVVVLVGAHHATDLVPIARAVVGGQRCEEACDLDDELRAVEAQERQIAGDLVVLPDVVGDRQTDVALAVRVVGHPPARPRVQVDDLALLAAVAPALPREHRAGEPFGARRAHGLRQAPVPIAQQRARQLGEAKVQEREHEQLVPEHVAPVRLPVEAARGNPGIEVDRVLRHRLQQVEDVQVQDERDAGIAPELQLALTPQIVPGLRVSFEQLGEPRGMPGGRARLRSRFADPAIE